MPERLEFDGQGAIGHIRVRNAADNIDGTEDIWFDLYGSINKTNAHKLVSYILKEYLGFPDVPALVKGTFNNGNRAGSPVFILGKYAASGTVVSRYRVLFEDGMCWWCENFEVDVTEGNLDSLMDYSGMFE